MTRYLDKQGLTTLATKVKEKLAEKQPVGNYATNTEVNAKPNDAPSDNSMYGKTKEGWEKVEIDNSELVLVTLKTDNNVSCNGQIVTINGKEYIYQGKVIKAKVPQGTSYTISVNDKEEFKTPASQTFTANQSVRNIEMVYEYELLGVFILDTDNNLFTSDKWTGDNQKAVGVAVLTENCKFVIAPTEKEVEWGGTNKVITDIVTTANADEAKRDFNGKTNTDKIITQLKGYDDGYGSIGAPACEYCRNYTFKNGKKGYLGSLGEWQAAYDNKTAVDACLKAIGVAIIPDGGTYGWRWSSTQDNGRSWQLNWADGDTYSSSRYTTDYVTPFCSFE